MTDLATIEPPTPAGRRRFWRRLSPAEKLRLAAEIVSAYARARWLLRRREVKEVVGALRATGADPVEPDGDRLLTGIRLGRTVGRTLGLLPADSRCLVRSLVLTSLLARRGIASTFVIGVRSEPEFAAHAWVECAGYPLLPAGGDEYSRIVEL